MKLHPKKQKFIGTPACSVRGKVLREKTNKPERLCRTLRTAGGHLISEIIFEPIPEVFKEGEQPTCSKYDLRPKSVDNTRDSMSRKRLLSDGHTGKTPAKKFPQLDVKKVAEKHVEKKSRGKPKTPEKRKKLTRRTSAEIKQNTKITEEGKETNENDANTLPPVNQLMLDLVKIHLEELRKLDENRVRKTITRSAQTVDPSFFSKKVDLV